MAFELVEFSEPTPEPGQPFPGTSQTVFGVYDLENEAIEVGRMSAVEQAKVSVRACFEVALNQLDVSR